MSYFQATDGTTLYYRDHGDGPPIVLLSSQGLSSSMWQHLMVRLADRGSAASPSTAAVTVGPMTRAKAMTSTGSPTISASC